MKRRKILMTGMLGCALLTAGIGLTMVHFLKEQETVSVSSMEPVQLELCLLHTEYTEASCGTEQVTGLLPGESTVWKPAVILDGTSPEAYIRVRLEFGGILEGASEESEEEAAARARRIRELQDGIRFCDGWLEGEDGYYYQEKAVPGKIIPVYDQVTVPENWDNEIAEKVFTIEISAEAVRADGLEPWLTDRQEIRNWEL